MGADEADLGRLTGSINPLEGDENPMVGQWFHSRGRPYRGPAPSDNIELGKDAARGYGNLSLVGQTTWRIECRGQTGRLAPGYRPGGVSRKRKSATSGLGCGEMRVV